MVIDPLFTAEYQNQIESSDKQEVELIYNYFQRISPKSEYGNGAY
jgi:hypothetical protein